VSDVNARIGIDFDTGSALAQLRRLQAGLSKFHQTLAEGNLAAAQAQRGLNATLAQSIAANGKFAVSQKAVATSTLAFTTALEKNKLSMKEYFRYSAAAATANTKTFSRMFAQEREIINRARRDRVKALQSQYIQMSKAQGGFVDAMRIMPRTLMMANGQFTELGTRIQYAAQRQQFLNQLLKQGSTNLLNFGKNMQWAGRQLMVGLTIPLGMLAGYASKAFRELEKSTIKFKRVYGDAFTSDAETAAAVQNVRTIANEYMKFGVAVTDTMEMAANAAAAGFQGADLDKQIRSATKLAVLGQIEQQQALETTISLQNAFGLSADELAQKINFLNAVENQTVLSIEDLTIAIPKAAPVVKQLGGNVEDLAFFLTAMKEGGINASEGANALKSGLASIINPTKKTSQMLAEMGINIKGLVEANAGDLKGTIVGFSRALDALDPLNRARAIEQMFGKFQFARLSTLFQNVAKDGSQASRALDLAGKSVEELAILSEREMKKIEESTTFKFQAAMEKFKQDIMPLGKAFLEALTPVVQFFGKVFEKFNSFSDGTKKVITVVTAIIAGIGPIALMTFGLMANGIANLIKLFATLRGGISKLNGQNSILGGGFDYVTQQELENQAASQALHNTHTRLTEVFNVEKLAVTQLASSYAQLSTQMRTMAQQNPALFAGGAAGAKSAVNGLPPVPKVKKFSDGVLSVPGPKGAGDVIPALVSPEESIIPVDMSKKYRGLITAIFNDDVPGFATGRLPWGNNHPVKKMGPIDIKGPRSFKDTQSQRLVAEQIADAVKNGRFGKMKPTDFGQLVQPFSGRSFPIPGVGGVYKKANGEMVVVKPTMDEKTALAEVRATEIARKVHGLTSPKQKIRTMIDPTDPTGKRKVIVLESPYDPKIANLEGNTKFSKNEMITQLVASTLRADKDLSASNVFGKVLADPGNAGVFSRASGFRDFENNLPGMGHMGMINLLGVKGGAKKFFAQETSGLAAQMTPKQYHDMVIKEIDKSIPKLRKLIDSWDLNPMERKVYENMYARLEDGKKINWEKMHAMHVAAGKTVKKFEVGNRPSSTEQYMREQLSKYIVADTQTSRLTGALVNDFDNAFSKELETLKKTNPERARKIEAAWKGFDPETKAATRGTQRQTQFHQIMKDMVPVRVGDEIRYISKKDFDKFASNPDQQIKNARTKEQVISKGLYRMGLRPDVSGRFVGGGDLAASRALSAKHFAFDMQYSDKAAGGGKGVLTKAIKEEDVRQRRILDDKLNKVFGKDGLMGSKYAQELRAMGLSDSDIRKKLSYELSHREKTGFGGRDPRKWTTGQALHDLQIINRYMTTKNRASKILAWNDSQLAKGKPGFLSKEQANEFRAAAKFMSLEQHPVTPAERALAAKAAQLDQLAYQNGVPGVTQKHAQSAKVVQMILEDQIGKKLPTPKAVLNLAATDKRGAYTSVTAVKPSEALAFPGGKVIPFTGSNTTRRGSNVVTDTGNRDTRIAATPPGSTVVKSSQAKQLIRMRGAADAPEANKYLREQTRRRLQAQYPGMSSADIEKAIEKKLKADARSARAAEKIAAAQEKEARRQEQLPKQRAAEQRQTDKINKAHTEALAMHAKYKEAEAKAAKKEHIKQQRMLRQEKVGRWSGGASMALGTAGMGLMMAGQQTAGMAAMGASAVAGMAPMLTNPYIAAGVAVTALVGSFWLLDKRAKAQAEATSKLIDTTTATTEKMKSIGEMTNKVGASELMEKRRTQGSSDRYTTGFERGKQQFGTTFLESDVGKNVLQGFKDNIVKNGAEMSAKQMSVQLAGYVSDGILSAEQAHSVAESIGLNLKNTALGAQISGQLLDLIGPSGDDLLKNPLEVRVKLVNEQRDLGKSFGFEDAANAAASQVGPKILINPKKMIDDVNKAKAIAAGTAAYGAQNLEFNQAQIDSLNIQYEKQIAILEKEKASTTNKAKQAELDDKIATLRSDQESQSKELRLINSDILKDQIEGFKIASKRSDVEDAFFDSLKNQVKTKWANDPMADAFLKTSADLDSKELEVTIDTVVASGQLSPMAATSLMTMFAGDETGLQKTINTALKFQDPGKFMETINFFSGMDPKVGKKNIKMLVKMSKENPAQADKLMSAIALMQKMDGKEVDLKAFFEGEGATKRLNDLADSLQAVEDHKGPFTLEALTEVKELGGVTLDGILSRWSEFENLPDSTKKTVIQEYVTLYKTIDDNAVNAEANRRSKGQGDSVYQYWHSEAGREKIRQDMAGEKTMQKVKQDITSNAAKAGSQDGSGSKKDPFADILTRLKNVRNAAINAAGGFKELQKAIAASGDKSVANKFVGIEQQLMKKGYNRDFIDYITGLDPEEQKKFGSVATKKGKRTYNEFNYETGKMQKRTVNYKKGDFVLTEQGNTMRQAYDKAIVGDFQIAQQDVIKNINEQEKAYRILKGLGLSNLEIEKAMENQAYVTAIATGQITKKELETNAALQKQALLREQIKSITDKTNQSQTRIDALKKAPDLINFLSGLKAIDSEGKEVGLTITSIYDAIQDPETLIEMIAVMEAIKSKTGDVESQMKILFDLISKGEAAKDLEKNLMTPLEKFQKAYDAAQKIFDAYKTMDQYTIQSKTSGFAPETGVSQFDGKNFKQLERLKTESDERLAEINAELAIYEHQISMIRTEIEKIERSVENMDVSELNLTIDGKKVTGKLKYVLEDLKEQISDWEREIEMKYERPIKTLQDESNVLSHDLEVMDYQAKKINEKYDDQVKALEEVQRVNDAIIRQQQQQLGLADALTQGDIAAAAQAAQEMRASNAADFATSQTDALSQARDNAINSLTNDKGMTKDQIDERRWQISQQIYALENDPARLALENSIQQAKDAIYNIEEAREQKLLAIRAHEERIYKIEQDKIFPLQAQADLETVKNLALDYQLIKLGNIIEANDRNRTVSGMTREQWEEMLAKMTLIDEKLKKELADGLAAFNSSSATTLATWEAIRAAYDAIKDKKVTITTINVIKTVTDGSGDGGDGGDNGNGGDTGDTNPYGGQDRDYDAKYGVLSQGSGFSGSGSSGSGSSGSKGSGSTTTSGNNKTNTSTTSSSKFTGSNTVPTQSLPDGLQKTLRINAGANTVPTASLPSGLQAQMKKDAVNKGANTVPKSSMPFGGKPIVIPKPKSTGSNTVPASSMPFGGKSIIPKKKSMGGLIKRYALGGSVIGTDIIPAMLTPGEFVMSRYAVEKLGVENMKAVNDGQSIGDSVYNYSINVNVKSDANPDEIAKTVMTHIQRVNSQNIRSVKIP
jgi:TP901 family phage tail tape measure protein